jgi:hypothetical protein
MATDDGATVRRLLAAIGIEPPDDEVEEMIKSYPALRASADALYSPEASHFVPAFVIDPKQSSAILEAK